MVLWEEDFTEVYQAIDELKVQGVEDFRTFFTENPDVVAELAKKIVILDVNEHALRVFECPSKEALLTGIDRIFVAETYPLFIEQLTAFAEGVDPFSCEAYVQTFTGKRLHIMFSVKMLHDQGHGLVTMVDISERKQMEEELRTVNQELRRSNSELEQFAYIASHDLQEPLRKIRSFGSLLERSCADQVDDLTSKYVASMVNSAKRMQLLIDDLLTLSRTGATQRAPQRVDCAQLVEDVIQAMAVSLEENNAEVTHDSLPEVTGDRTLLFQALQNLIGNGVKFQRDITPRVHISARRADGEWVFSVRDNGIGIESKYLKDIFIAFKRLHGRSAYPGTGIGLAIVQKIVDYHRGRIWVESTVGEGSTFFFSLPVQSADGSTTPPDVHISQ